MLSKIKIITLLIFTCGVITSFDVINLNVKQYSLHKTFKDTITVGIKLNDSTGQVNISNPGIQTSVISVLPELDSCSITSRPASIIYGKQISYLVFEVNSLKEGNLTIAIQISLHQNNFKFLGEPGGLIHKCRSTTACGCNFLLTPNRSIIGCGCNSNNNFSDSCNHRFFSIK